MKKDASASTGLANSIEDAADAIRKAMREHGLTEAIGVIHADDCALGESDDNACTCEAPEVRISLEPS